MNTQTPSRPVFRAGRLALILVAAGASLARAQLTPAAPAPEKKEETVVLQTFMVIGSNIKRLDQEKTMPVTVLDREGMEARDASQSSDLLTSLPQVTGLPGNETATLGATARGDNATISLRGIPSSNTLVMLNGRVSAVMVTGTPVLGDERPMTRT